MGADLDTILRASLGVVGAVNLFVTSLASLHLVGIAVGPPLAAMFSSEESLHEHGFKDRKSMIMVPWLLASKVDVRYWYRIYKSPNDKSLAEEFLQKYGPMLEKYKYQPHQS